MSANLSRKNESTLFDIPGCEFSEVGLVIKHKLSYDQWERMGAVLRKAESGIQWWLGDWMGYGEQRYGEKSAQAFDVHEQTGLNVDTLRNYQWVADHVSPVVRRITLPWSYHQVVAALDPAEQSTWLGLAETEGWTYRELKREVEKAQRAKSFKLVSAILDKVWERIQDGCYTAEAILKCGECGKNIFDLEAEQVRLYMQQLVGSGKAEWRDQGGKTEVARGDCTKLCVPKDLPLGSDFHMPYTPTIEWGEDSDD